MKILSGSVIPAAEAPMKTMNLAQKPAVKGNPIKLIKHTVKPIDAAGRR